MSWLFFTVESMLINVFIER